MALDDFLLLLPWLAAAGLVLVSVGLLVLRDWRTTIMLLAFQGLGVFLLVAQRWTLELAGVKLVAAWLSAAMLALALLSSPARARREEDPWPTGRLFRLLAAALVLLSVSSLAPQTADWAPGLTDQQRLGSLVLLGMGLLQLGLTNQPFRIIIGLLTILAGFEILYAAVESSILVAGLLAAVNLGLALGGAYLLLAPEMESDA